MLAKQMILLKEISFNLIDNILVFGIAQLQCTQLLKVLANRGHFCVSISRARASFYFP